MIMRESIRNIILHGRTYVVHVRQLVSNKRRIRRRLLRAIKK